jgi:hypothetical protein
VRFEGAKRYFGLMANQGDFWVASCQFSAVIRAVPVSIGDGRGSKFVGLGVVG